MAVAVLILIGIALAFGTIHETRFGTPAAQHYFYRAIWFQGLLFFLCINLVVSAFRRFPWKKHHAGFVMTHLGIILILIGNLLGIWFSVEGTILIPEGESRDYIELPRDVLWVQSSNPGIPVTFPLALSTRPWVHDVQQTFSHEMEGKPFTVTIDQYLPNTAMVEEIVEGTEEFPAVLLEVTAFHQPAQQFWLFSRDPERFGFRWGDAHFLFFEVRNEAERRALEEPHRSWDAEDKGTLHLAFRDLGLEKDIPVHSFLGKAQSIEGTPYTLTIKEYFPDFIIGEQGPTTRSKEPHNPALAFILEGPEGKDSFLVFALHPEFEERHGFSRTIHVQATYEMSPTLPPLPPGLLGVVRSPETWYVVTTSLESDERQLIPLSLNETYTHPTLDVSFRALQLLTHARRLETFRLKDNEVKQQAIHLTYEAKGVQEERWLRQRGAVHFQAGDDMVVVAYQPAKRTLPFSIQLADFRKVEYPGTTVPSDFESDLEIEDLERGLRLTRTISMNNPLTYRGFTLFQSSFVEGPPVEATVLSVRNDLGTPVVYAGFGVVVIGLITMFYFRKDPFKSNRKKQ